MFFTMRFAVPSSLAGGYDAAERKLACFGDEELCGYVEDPPICCIRIEPVNAKFSDALTHRDFLGSVMGLGLKREVLGDIVLEDNCGYLFCHDTVAPYIIEQLNQVRHTTVRCSVSEARGA